MAWVYCLNNLRQHVTFSCHIVKGFTHYFVTVFLADDKHPVTKPPPPPTVKPVKSKHKGFVSIPSQCSCNSYVHSYIAIRT